MSKQWYITVGYPGGEFAHKCDEADYWKLDEYLSEKAELTSPSDPASVLPGATALKSVLIRPAPPETAEWLDAEMWHGDGRVKVPGGWMVQRTDRSSMKSAWSKDFDSSITTSSMCFAPVALTSGITVLEVQE